MDSALLSSLLSVQTLPDSLDDFLLPGSEEVVPELYVVGTQETTGQLREWEVLLQQTLGPSHLLLSSVSLGELSLILFLRRDLLWFCSGQPPPLTLSSLLSLSLSCLFPLCLSQKFSLQATPQGLGVL